MAIAADEAARASNFIDSIGINVHLEYTDGAYASESNVAKDLIYLGISNIRDAVPTDSSSIPVQSEIAGLSQLAASGVKLDLVVSNTDVAAQINALNALEQANPGAIRAVEGPNEINNWPVTYEGLTGESAALAFQAALYSAVKADSALAGVRVFDFTGGVTPIETPEGTLTENADGSYLLTEGITGWVADLPPGVTTITITYSGAAPIAGLFESPGNGQQSALTSGANGTLTFTYDNTGTSPLQTYVSVSDWTGSTTITGVSAVSGSSGNLVTFHPDTSLAGLADDANGHPYPTNRAQPGSYLAGTAKAAQPNPFVITEDGYETDPNDPNGVSALAQAQGDLKILLDAYKDGSSQTYLYELLDEKSDPTDSNSQFHFGVFNSDNTAKPAAAAIHNLTTILNDPGATASSFTPGTLNWSASGMAATSHSLLLEKSDGAFDIVLWDEPAAGTTTADTVKISLGATYGTVKIFDPVTGSAAVSTLTNVSQLTLGFLADPRIIEVEPAGGVSAAVQTPVASATLAETQVAGLAPAQIGTFSADEVGAMTPAQLAAFSPRQLSALSAAGAAGLTREDIAGLSAADVAALKPAAFGALSTEALAGLKPSDMRRITAADIEAIVPMRFLAIPDADISALTAKQMTSLTSEQIAGFSLHQIAAMSPADIALLTAAQAPALSTTQIQALTEAQVKKLSADALGHFTAEEARAFTPRQLGVMSLTQHHALSLI